LRSDRWIWSPSVGDGFRLAGLGDLSNDREIADEFAAPAEVAGDSDALELWLGLADRILGVGQQGGGPVQMEAAFTALCDSQALQNLGLK
jgi:hypothetical protein